jgi:hypothetical protein
MKTIDIQIALTVFAIAFAVTSVIVIIATGPKIETSKNTKS